MSWRAYRDWWLGQLADWVPDGMRQRLAEKRGLLVVGLGRSESAAHAVVEGRRYDLGTVGSTDRHHAALAAALGDLPRRPAELEVRLQPGEYLRRDFDLPLAAEGGLRDAVELQLDRLTPFSAEEVVFQCGIRERDPAAKRLGAWLAAVPAGRLRPLLEALGEQPALAPRPPRAPPAADEPLVLRYALTRERRRGYGWLVAAASLALLAAAVTVHVRNREAELARLQDDLAQVRREAAEGSDLAEKVEQLRAAATVIASKRTARPLLVEVLEDLSARIPDDSYLQRVELRQGELQLVGVSTTASNLIRQLEASPLLTDVRFESSVTRDVTSGKERFTIVARLAPAAKGSTGQEGGS
jgi:general secretion pathway protein L